MMNLVNLRTWVCRVVVVPVLVSGMACGGAAPPADSSASTKPADTASGRAGAGARTDAGLGTLTPEALKAALQGADGVWRSLPRETFDPKAVVERVGRDPQRLFAWVQDNTWWVPYRGALRGPAGVLMDRLGNSLDRSLLLAELLRESGQTVRLAHATLSIETARPTLARIALPPMNQPSGTAAPDDQIARRTDDRAKALGLSGDQIRIDMQGRRALAGRSTNELVKRVPAQTAFLANALGTPPATQGEDARALSALRDHWWVQRQEGDSWVDHDPMFAAATPGNPALRPDRMIAFDRPSGRLPTSDEDSHAISIRVVIEQWTPGGTVEKTVLNYRARPAELSGRPISLLHAPTAYPPVQAVLTDANPIAAIQAAMLRQSEWVPVLSIGTELIGQKGFNDAGELVDPPRSSSAMVTSRTRSSFGGFGDSLGSGGGEATPAPRLTAEWIDYEIHVPGKTPRTIRREVFDLLRASRSTRPLNAPDVDDALRVERALALTGTIDMLPMAARLSREYVQSLVLGDLTKHAEPLTTRARQLAAGDKVTAAQNAAAIRMHNPRLLELGLARFEWSSLAAGVYLDAPNLLTYRRTRILQGDRLITKEGFDVVANSVGVNPNSVMSPFATRMAQGIVDTNVEALLVDDASTSNAGVALAAWPAADQWITLRQTGDLPSMPPGWSPGMKRRVSSAVDAGLVVVAPRRGTNTDQLARSFWTIDRTTGDTLGVGDLGWGQGATEYVVAGAFIAVAGMQMSATLCYATLPYSAPVNAELTCLNPSGFFLALYFWLAEPTPPAPPAPNGNFDPPWLHRNGQRNW